MAEYCGVDMGMFFGWFNTKPLQHTPRKKEYVLAQNA
jgi:hypothetical protein